MPDLDNTVFRHSVESFKSFYFLSPPRAIKIRTFASSSDGPLFMANRSPLPRFHPNDSAISDSLGVKPRAKMAFLFSPLLPSC